MKFRSMLSIACGLMLAGAAVLPASAATMSTATSRTARNSHVSYYVSLTGKAHACEVVTHTPKHKMMVGTHSYHSHAAAAHAMAASKLCRG